MWHGIEEGFEFDVVIGRHTVQTPFGEFVVSIRKAGECGRLDTLKEMPATDAQPAHDVVVDAIECLANGGIGFSKREEGLIAQTPQNA
nr:hypothetical protein [Rhizobium azibense]